MTCTVSPLFRFTAPLPVYGATYNFFRIALMETFVRDISDFTRKYDFIFEIWLCHDDLYCVFSFQVCHTSTSCLPSDLEFF